MIAVLTIITVLVLLIGSYTDLKTREVPDWLSFAAIIAALGTRLIFSVWESNPSYIIEGMMGFAAFFILACTLYYLGQWGGGDSKMLMAIGALIGLKLEVTHFMVGFIVNLLFVGGVYGLFWSLGLALVHWKGVHKELQKFHKIKQVQVLRIITYIAAVLIICLAFVFPSNAWVLIILSATFMALFHLWLLIRAVEKSGMIKRRAVGKLTEGDWVVKETRHRGKYICGPKDLGLTKIQIAKLKKYKIRSILIKEGIPFIPSFLITYGITYFFGNLVMYFL